MPSDPIVIVELVYDEGCPNVVETRANLLRAFHAAGQQPHWMEWSRSDPDSPARVRGFGSPTVLINGHDLASQPPVDTQPSCRLYRGVHGGFRGAPEPEVIASALKDAATGPRRFGSRGLVVIPGIVFALLPKLACPACWPAYAGLLSSLGLGFLLSTEHLFLMTSVFLAIAVGTLAIGKPRRHGYGPFFLGLLASAVVLAGKFYYGSNLMMYLGLGLLVGATVWNAFPARRRTRERCAACSPNNPGSTERNSCHEQET